MGIHFSTEINFEQKAAFQFYESRNRLFTLSISICITLKINKVKLSKGLSIQKKQRNIFLMDDVRKSILCKGDKVFNFLCSKRAPSPSIISPFLWKKKVCALLSLYSFCCVVSLLSRYRTIFFPPRATCHLSCDTSSNSDTYITHTHTHTQFKAYSKRNLHVVCTSRLCVCLSF